MQAVQQLQVTLVGVEVAPAQQDLQAQVVQVVTEQQLILLFYKQPDKG